MIKFAPRNRDLVQALHAIDTIGHDMPTWVVPVGDGEHVDVRAMSETQVLSIRLWSINPVEDVAMSFPMEHYGMHLLGSLAGSDGIDGRTTFEAGRTLWRAANQVGGASGRRDSRPEPNWDQLMVPPIDDGVVIDPELLGMDLANLLCGEIPATLATSGDGLALSITTGTVSLYTIGISKDVVRAVRQMMQN